MTVIGVDVLRVDGPTKVLGAAQYTVDLELPGMVYAKALRSTYPHARVVRVDASKAERLPGVVAVLTRDDVAYLKHPFFGPVVKDQPIVAVDRVRFVGDIVAAVAAEERDIAEEALDLIEVDYEPLLAVFDPLEAIRPGASILHEQRVTTDTRPDLAAFHFEANSNICSVYHVADGDLDQGFAEADEIFEGVYTTPKLQHGHIEPHAAAAYWEPSGKLVVYSACQNPAPVRAQLADLFEIPQSQVRVIVPFVGGGYGGKVHAHLEPVVAALARKARRPVHWILTREEVFLTSHGHAAVVKIRTGVKRDGTLVARRVEGFYDTGAYAFTGPSTSKNSGEVSCGPYRIPHQRLSTYCVYTNSPPAGPFRGFGVPQVCWAYETQMDEIARGLGLDPLEIRLKNLVHEGDTFVTGDELFSVGAEGCLRQVAEAIGWDKATDQPNGQSGRYVRGKGLAVAIKTTMTPSHSSASVRMNADGSATALTSSVEIGQGALTSLAQIVAEELSLPPEKVTVTFPDTEVTPFDSSTSSSRTTFSMGHALQQSAWQVREQLLEIAAKELEARPEDLELTAQGVQVRGAPDRRRTIPQLFAAHYGAALGSLFGSYSFQTRGGVDAQTGKAKGRASAFFFYAACGAEVEVDTETGHLRVVRIATSADAGKAINPRQCHMQNEGSMLTALGSALFEEMLFDNGQPINCTFLDYMPPSMEDSPNEFRSLLVETPHPDGPFGAKGMGEAALPPVAPAIGNALATALGGARVRTLPLRPDKVVAAIREATSSPSAVVDGRSTATGRSA